jgi:hypothetical protein
MRVGERRRSGDLLVLFVVAWSAVACGARPGKPKPPERPPILFTGPSGAATNEFQLHDSLLVELRDLTPRAGYELAIVDEAGNAVVTNRLSTDARGRIPQTVLWYAIGAQPCWRAGFATSTEGFSYARVTDSALAGRNYTLRVTRAGEAARSATFSVVRGALRPSLYTTDARGCPKTGFLIGEEDVWVVGRNFPAGGLLRLWTIGDQSEWPDNTPLTDRTGQYGYDWPSLIELAPTETHFRRRLWPRGLTSIGSYDLVAETVSYPFGTYREAPQAQAQEVVAQRTFSAFVVQRRPGAEPLQMDVAGAVSSPFTFRSTFLTSEDVYVGVDPALQPTVIGQTADVFIVADKTDAQWTVDQSLTDVTGTVETITVNGICGNCWKTLAWTAPLTPGRYDVVLDFNRDGVYTPGTDLIDSVDPTGFTVADVRVDQISFNFGGAGAITLYDHLAGSNVAAPEYVSAGHLIKPAAWVRGGTHSVRVRFKAVSGLSSAQVFAQGGLGGLASSGSPVTVTFSGGFGEADFSVNSPPAAVARTVFTWDWKQKVGPSIVELGRTGDHRLYTVLATPQAPQATPWVGALEVAAVVAQGETTAAGATQKIWSQFYNSAGGSYDTFSGSPRYAGGGTSGNFNLTLWLTNYASANIGVVNCYDMGKAIVVFANALGASAEYVYSGPFGYLNLVKPIGKGWANNPFYDNPSYNSAPVVDGDWSFGQGRSSFGNHAFAQVGGQIYDASGGQVDTDSDPDTLPAGTPRALDGNDSWLSSYRSRVVDNVPASSPVTPAVYTFSVY